jgi:hypothetical protein
MTEAPRTSAASFNSASLFEPDILTKHEFLRVSRPRSRFEPEQRLMFAVLSDAVECFQRYAAAKNPEHRKLYRDAEAWINSENSRWPCSFESICEVLEIDPTYLRLGLMRWRATYQSRTTRHKRLREPLRYQYRVKRHRVCV